MESVKLSFSEIYFSYIPILSVSWRIENHNSTDHVLSGTTPKFHLQLITHYKMKIIVVKNIAWNIYYLKRYSNNTEVFSFGSVIQNITLYPDTRTGFHSTPSIVMYQKPISLFSPIRILDGVYSNEKKNFVGTRTDRIKGKGDELKHNAYFPISPVTSTRWHSTKDENSGKEVSSGKMRNQQKNSFT